MNLHSALVVLARHGFADLHSERLHDSAVVFIEAVQASMEGLDTHDISEALRWAFQDDRPDMQKRLVACLGFLLGRLHGQADAIKAATPEEWKHTVAMDKLNRDPSSCAVCMTHVKPIQGGNVYNCPQCGATFIRNGPNSAWRASHIKVPALIPECDCMNYQWLGDKCTSKAHTCNNCGRVYKWRDQSDPQDSKWGWQLVTQATAPAPDSATPGPTGPTS